MTKNAGRKVRAVYEGKKTLEGAGVRLKRVFGFQEAPRFDPFLLLVSGKPIGEPVAWRGPIVMNTEEELATAFAEYRDGTFIKT